MNHISEIKRLEKLISYGILDTPPEAFFEELARLIAIVCDTPMALISFLDDKRQWYKAKIGVSQSEVPIEETICQYTLTQEVLEIPDTFQVPLLDNNSHVHSSNGIRFYLGVSMRSPEGLPIGSVCALDLKPREISPAQTEALQLIARQIIHHLEMEQKNRVMGDELKKVLESKIEEAKRQIQLKELAYNNLFQAISRSNAIMEFSPEGKILSANQHFEDLLGYAEEELVGNYHQKLMSEEDEQENKAFWTDLRSGDLKMGRFRRRHKDGSTIWVQASYNPVLDEDGKLLKVTKIAQNITREMLQQVAMENAKSMAESLNSQKDAFIANVSHEIRTPINAVLGFADLLIETEEDPHKLNYLSSIQVAGENLLYLVNDILDLSKIESGNFQIDNAPFQLRATVNIVVSMLEVKATQKGLQFMVKVDDNVPDFLLGDKNRLTQILVNLVGNAIKFTTAGMVKLNIHAENAGERVIIHFEVSDTGLGIAPDKLNSIFDRFTQGETDTSRKYGGTGLGLNITQQLAILQGGKIHAESTLGKGSTFHCIIPFAIDPRGGNLSQDHRSQSGIVDLKGRVLLCEDNRMNQMIIQAIFKDTEVEVDIANNGLEGLECLRKKAYQLVLLDIQMPEMDGYQTVTAIRQNLGLDVPIIALTAHSMIKEKNRCLAMGMNDYLSKPFRKEELLDTMARWMAKAPTPDNGEENSGTEPSSISMAQLQEYAGGDDDFVMEMLEMFLAESKAGMEALEQHVQNGQMKEAAGHAHKLITTFGVVGAGTSPVTQLEQSLLKGIPEIEIGRLLVALKSQLNQIRREIAQILKR